MTQIKHNDIEKVLPRTGLVQSGDPTDPIKDEAKTICPCTNAVRSIPAEDSTIIQDGRGFKAEIKFTLAPETEKLLVFITPPSTAEIPLYVIWGTDIVKGDVNNIDYQLYEEASWVEDPGDTEQPIININRVLSGIVLPQSQLFNATINPVSLVGATEIDIDSVLGGQATGPQTSPVGGVAAGLRFNGPLKPSTKHALRLYNNDDTLTANITVKSVFIEGTFQGLYEKANP